MAPKSPARRLKRWVIVALWVLAGVLVALSPTFGRAEPSGEYRPPLPPDALTNGCYPLPEGVTFDFPYQVRSDGDLGGLRILVVQYDLIDQDEAVEAVTESFLRAGFAETPLAASAPGRDDARRFEFAKGSISVTGSAIPLVPLKDDQLVRGTLRLALPVVERQSDAAVCSDATSTKRFTQDGDQGGAP